MKKIISIVLSIVLAISITGCKREQREEIAEEIKESESRIYYIDGSESRLVSESYQPKGETVEELIIEYLEALTSEPQRISYKKAILNPVRVIDYTLKEKGQLTLNFSEEYNALTGITEILLRAAIVKTLCQIDGVEYIEFYVNGQPLMISADKAVGFMASEDFIDNTGGETNFYQNATISLFFANKDGKTLQEIRVNVVYDGTISMEQLVMEQLIAGPESISGVGLEEVYPTIPSNTKIIKISVKDGICYLDVNEKFLEKLPDISNEVAIYSVVNSLAELSSIDKVQFTINGEQISKYRENTQFDKIFDRNLDIVK